MFCFQNFPLYLHIFLCGGSEEEKEEHNRSKIMLKYGKLLFLEIIVGTLGTILCSLK